MCDDCLENPDNKNYIKEEIKDGIFRLTPVELSGILNLVETFNGEIISITKEGEEMGITADALKDIVEKEVALKTARGECFTAYDITKRIRAFIKSNVPHAEVREEVYRLIDSDDPIVEDYETFHSYTAFNGDGVRIYYPEGGDPTAYLAVIDPSTVASSVSTDDTEEDLKEAALAVIQANDELQRAIKTLIDIVDPDDASLGSPWD
jgi:hypothetical protein